MIPTLRSWLWGVVDFVAEVVEIRRDIADERRGRVARAAEWARRRQEDGGR